MNPVWTFAIGIAILILFGWYFATDSDRRKRWIGLVLGLVIVGLCIEACYPPEKKIRLGLDLQGGTSFTIRLIPNEGQEINPDSLEKAVEVIRKRVDKYGVSEPVITPQGTDTILVQIPGLDTEQINAVREQLQKVAKLEFKLVHPESQSIVAQIDGGSGIVPPGYRLLDTKNEGKLVVKNKSEMEGNSIQSAHAYYDAQGYGISLTMTKEGAKLFGDVTAANVNQRLAIIMDGQVQSAPNINEAIYTGTAQITGQFEEKEARDLASVLENPLETPVKIEEMRGVSSTLGGNSIASGVAAGVVGLAMTLICVIVYYRFSGVIACFAMLINLVVLFGVMSMFGFVLTLPGIAGVILTIGMAIDANVLIYERLREELAAGKSLKAAVNAAYDKAFSAIFDANVTTLITSIILFWKATGPVQGFAVTLTVGIIASMFTALLITRNCFEWVFSWGLIKKISMMNLIKATNYDFLGKRKSALIASIALIVVSMGVFALRGDKNFGVDFKGGDRLVLEAAEKVSEGEVRDVMEKAGFEGIVQMETTPQTKKEFVTIRSGFETGEKILEKLESSFPDKKRWEDGKLFKVEQSDKVGKLVGNALAWNSLIALALGLLGILVYVTARFEFSFALASIVAVLHDIIITIGVFALFGREISLVIVGAILTVAGYSINDTIVVFDRVREGIQSGRKGSLLSIMNQSINETLSRTILTGGTTLLATAALYFMGGPVLNDFALVILIGVLVGTYSSIFIATPVVYWCAGKSGKLENEIKRSQAAEVIV